MDEAALDVINRLRIERDTARGVARMLWGEINELRAELAALGRPDALSKDSALFDAISRSHRRP